MVSDYPEAYQGQKELAFLSNVPTSWDETRVLNAKVGDYITIGRRHGKEWYVGSITGSHGVDLDIPLDFCRAGDFMAEIYSDAQGRRRESHPYRAGDEEGESHHAAEGHHGHRRRAGHSHPSGPVDSGRGCAT